MIRVLLVDDQSLLRMGFRLILEAEPDIEVSGEAGDGATGVSMAAALHPDVVLMDVRMPGMDGIAATAASLRVTMTVRWWATMSCISRVIRARSAAAASAPC